MMTRLVRLYFPGGGTQHSFFRGPTGPYPFIYSMLPSIRTVPVSGHLIETRTQFLRGPFQLSVNKVFRMKAEHFSFKIKVLAI